MIRDIKNSLYILKYVWRARKSFIFIEFSKSIISSALEVTSIILFKNFIDMLNKKTSLYFIIPVVILYALCKKIHEFSFEYIGLFQLPKTNYALNRELTKDIIKKASEIDLKCYDNTEFYNQYTRALAETGERSIKTLNIVSSIIYSTISSIGMFSVIISMDPISIFLALTIFLSYTLFTNKSKHLVFERDMELTQYNRAMSYYKNAFFSRSFAKDFKIYPGISDYMRNEFVSTSKKAETIHMKNASNLFKYTAIKTFLLLLNEYLLPLIYFSFRVLEGFMSIGSVTAMWETIRGLASNFSSFVYSFSEIKQSSLYIDNLRYVLNYEPEISNVMNSLNPPKSIETICFHNVSFKYEEKGEYILKNINLEITKNQKVAFVGHNGAGKSTLIKLLLRFYDPTEGYITVNSINIKNYNLEEYRKLFISMFQDYSLFSVPISVNVLTRAPKDSKEKELIKNALSKAGLSEAIDDDYINKQYSKEFDDDGIVFSGGEQQKIALARVFATKKSASVLILDEPSASLDVESELLFHNNLFAETQDKIVITISHRLSTTKDSDVIFFLENGQLEECGNHESLMFKKGKYEYIFNLQAQKYRYDSANEKIEKLNF